MSLETLDWRRRVHALYGAVRTETNPKAAYALWRDERDVLLSTHRASPVPLHARSGFCGASYGHYDENLRFEVPVCEVEASCSIAIETGTDGLVPFRRIGRVELDGLGTLDVWWLDSYGGGVFVPFRDAAATSYGGGRYLIDTVKGPDLGGTTSSEGESSLVLDFNFAYNPSCAYDPAWACPLAPAGNVLSVAIDAGEHQVDLGG